MPVHLTPKKDIAARLLSKGYLQAEVARDARVDVTKQTMTTWMKDQDFLKKIDEYKSDIFKQAEDTFARNVGDAAEAIVEIAIGKARDENGKPIDHRLVASKLKAALFIIERTMGKKQGITKIEPQEEIIEEIDEEDIDKVLEAIEN